MARKTWHEGASLAAMAVQQPIDTNRANARFTDDSTFKASRNSSGVARASRIDARIMPPAGIHVSKGASATTFDSSYIYSRKAFVAAAIQASRTSGYGAIANSLAFIQSNPHRF